MLAAADDLDHLVRGGELPGFGDGRHRFLHRGRRILVDAAADLAAEVAANAPLGVQLTKSLMRAAVTIGPASGRASVEQQTAVFQSIDAAEGAAAFMEKRAPRFSGT